VGVEEFMEALKLGSEERERMKGERISFAHTCTWMKRVDTLYKMIDSEEQRIGEKIALFRDKP
jgi:hypothetical protein